jgi:DNA-binding NarL/FixJ family response regulator
MNNAQEQGQFRSSRLVIADDHPLFRAGIRQMLSQWPDLVVVGEADDGWEAVKLCQRLRPELVLIGEPESLLEALNAGASGYVLKHLGIEHIVEAIRRVLEGGSPVDQEVAMELLRRLIEERQQKEESTPKPSLSTPLSAREVEVLELLARGQSNQQIAKELSISTSTVKNHVHRIINKLGVSDRVNAVIMATDHNMISM